MGRPSTLVARAEKKDGVVTRTWVGGASVLVSEGTIYLDLEFQLIRERLPIANSLTR